MRKCPTEPSSRLDELKEKIEEGNLPLFPIDAAHLLGEAAEPPRRLARGDPQ